MLRGFFCVCTPASVSAAGRLFFLLPDSFFPSFVSLLSFVPLPLPGQPSEMRLEAFSPERRVILHRNFQMRLKTYENQSEKGTILKIYLFAIGLLSFQDFLTCLVECRRHYGEGDGRLYCANFFLKYYCCPIKSIEYKRISLGHCIFNGRVLFCYSKPLQKIDS